MTAPLLAPGYLLVRDAVSTPRSYLTDAALGLAEAAPRALPQDFLIAVLSTVVDGGVLVKALLILGLWLAGWGAAQLSATVLPAAGRAGECVAVTVAIWNPYVAERLLQGHWSLLVGYGCLPWVAREVIRLRRGGGSWWALVFWTALAGLTPTGLVLAVIVAATCVAVPGAGVRRPLLAAVTLGIGVLTAAPWLAAVALSGSLSGPPPATGVPAFAARAEPGLGTLGSLAGLGGLWNADAVPVSRTSLFAVAATAVLLAVVAAGAVTAVRRPDAVPLLVLAAVAVVLPALAATGPGLALLDAVVRTAPGLGILRDAQKWVALAMPGYALCGAGAVLTLRSRIPAGTAAALCCAALVAVLPDLAWGVGAAVTPVRYPPGWASAAAQINADPRTVAVLPTGSMRQFGWAGDAPVLDPLPRWVAAEVLTTGDLVIGGQTLPGEGRRARAVQQLLLDGASDDELAAAGVGWVVAESGDGITVRRVGGDTARSAHGGTARSAHGGTARSAHRGTAVAAHLVWLTLLSGGLAGMAYTARRTARRLRATR